MLKKLKRRFIIYTVSLFSVIAIATVTGLFYGEYTRWQNLTKNALDRMLESALITQRTLTTTTTDSRDQNSVGKHIGVSGDDAIEAAHAIDTFAVILNNDYSIQSMKTNSYSSIDDSLQRKLVAQVLQDNNQTGVIYSGNYVFRYIMKGNGIAFADVRNEYNALREMLVSSLIAIVSAIIFITGISMLLASWAMRPVEESWNKQRQFVSDASHELRTPLTVILSNTAMLLEHPERTIDSQRKWLGYIQTEAQRMKELVERLLFLAKNDQSDTKLLMHLLSLSDTIYEVCLPLEPVVYEHNKTMELRIQPDVFVEGNLPYLKQLIVILVDNAIKYSGPQGKITISLQVVTQKAQLTVRNTGAPIPTDQIAHLFERFYRIDESRQREEDGYGLGLSMAKTIVDAHGGKIIVKSSVSEDTQFIVQLPMNGKK